MNNPSTTPNTRPASIYDRIALASVGLFATTLVIGLTTYLLHGMLTGH